MGRLVLRPCDTRRQSFNTARSAKCTKYRGHRVLLREHVCCCHALNVSHKTQGWGGGEADDRPQVCIRLLCLTAEQLTLNSQEGWLYIFFYRVIQISSLPAVEKKEGFCHSFINTRTSASHFTQFAMFAFTTASSFGIFESSALTVVTHCSSFLRLRPYLLGS